MAVTILHMADAHLDTPFGSREALREGLREAQLQSFRRAAALAKTHRADAFVVSGDLCDSGIMGYSTVLTIREVFADLLDAGIAVLYTHGNHDPAGECTALQLPEGVIEFSDPTPREYTLRKDGLPIARFLGMGFTDKTAAFPGMLPPRTVLPTIGIAHTQLRELGNAPEVMGVSARVLKSSGYDYWALGHIHARQTLEGCMAYPGCLTGRDYGESGEKGVLLVRIEAFRPPQIQFLPVEGTRFLKLEERDRCEETLSALTAGLEQTIRPKLPREGRTLLRIVLSGRCGVWKDLKGFRGKENLNTLSSQLTGRLGVEDTDIQLRDLVPYTHPEEFAGEANLLGKALSIAAEAEGDERILDALLAEIEDVHFLGDELTDTAQRKAYLRSLLRGQDARLCRELRKEED